VITACGVLHNICKARNIPLPNDDEDDDGGNADGDDDDDHPDLVLPGQAVMGVRYREQFAITNFS
jgi:hypothetical protein